MKAFISLSCISVLALSVTACASGNPTATNTAALSKEQCKEHVSQFVPTQNKNDAILRKDAACAQILKG